MSGVGSTNAMKKGSANNPFLAYSEADMQGFLNSAYTGCIVKYTGPAIHRTFSEQNLTIPEAAQNLVFTRDVRGPWASFDSGNMKIQITEKTDEGTNTWYLAAGQYVNGEWKFDRYYAFNGTIVLTDSLSAHPTSIRKLWTIEDKWNNDYINDQGNLTFWAYDKDVTFTIAPIDTDMPVFYDKTTAITIVPYKVNELYKVVYGDGEYYYEKYCHISDTPTTANSDYMAPGKTAFDFTGNLQTGNGSKINPYLAYTVAELQSFPVGSFIKWLGPNKTVLDATTGQVLIQNEVYRAVEDGDVFQYVILPTLSNPGTAADLAQGKQLIDGDGKVVEGEAAFSSGDYSVKVIDYDGTVLMEKKGNTGDVIDLPTAPTHDKLVFQEWSASVAVSDNKVTIDDNDVMVGAVYTTVSGQNEFDITLTKVTGLTIALYMDGTKDWGDGTSDTLTSHTYTAYGDYTIKCNGTQMTTSSSSGLFGQSSSSRNYYCTAVRFATVTSIGTYAFTYCYSLTSIVISNSVTRIIGYTFYVCASLISIVIPNSVTSIGTYAFYNCYSLINIVIPNSVTIIQGRLISGCNSLTSIVIPNNVTSIGGYAFCECSSLTKIIIPNGVTSIGTYAFNACSSLTSIVIPNSVTSIGNEAFAGIRTLTSIVIPSVMTSVRDSTFSGCASLTNIVIPNSITKIGVTAFYACYSLTSIVIPNSVTNIGERAFGDCYSLTRCDFSQHTVVPKLSGRTAFSGVNGLCKIIVPDSLYDEWIAETNWSTYADYIYKASEEVTQ